MTDFTFLAPEYFLLLLLPIIIWLFWPSKKSLKQEPEFFFPQLNYLIKSTNDSFIPKISLPHFSINLILLSFIWILLTIAAARPIKINQIHKSENLGYDIMLVLDTSLSMNALDFSKSQNQLETRLEIVKNILKDFITKRNNDRLGLIIFGDYPILESPLTTDNDSLITILENVETAAAGRATAIGDALTLATKKLLDSPNKSRVIILLTDGENTAGSFTPVAAAGIAAKYNIPLHTIGIGSNQRVPFLSLNGRISYQYMEFNPEALEEISQLTKGKYFYAKDATRLSKIYEEIDKLIKYEFKAENIIYHKHYYFYFLNIAVILWLIFLLNIMLSNLKREVE